MKKYDVTLRGHYEKTISVYADSPEEAEKKTEIVLFDTDLIDFSDEDFVCGEADITESLEDGCEENADEDGGLRNVRTSAPYAKNVCTRTSVKIKSYQALNLVSQIRLLGAAPNTPLKQEGVLKNE